jgi:hypothetical protein
MLPARHSRSENVVERRVAIGSLDKDLQDETRFTRYPVNHVNLVNLHLRFSSDNSHQPSHFSMYLLLLAIGEEEISATHRAYWRSMNSFGKHSRR